MHLLRLATIYLDPYAPEVEQRAMDLGIVKVSPMGPIPGKDKVGLLVYASVPLERLPRLTKSGEIEVPQVARQLAEDALRAYANIAATFRRASRHIASPSPYVALQPGNAEEKSWLESTQGILGGFFALPGGSPSVDWSDEVVAGLSDRLDGLELCAEAQSQPTSGGKFRDFVRLFERAFGEHHMDRLSKSLLEFLESGGHGYTKQEVRDWLKKKRNLLSHAGQRGRYLVDAAISPVVGRVEQAAYDVLFNKELWRNSEVTRRKLWAPTIGTADAMNSVFLTKGEDATVHFQVFDRLGGFTADLNASLNTLPDGWWARKADTK